MKIVSVASEMTPYAKTGGLADVAGTLTKEIHSLEHDILAFLPKYREIETRKDGFQCVIDRLEVPLGSEKVACRVFHTVDSAGVQVYLIEHPEFFNRDHLYGTPLADYPDNDRRFAYFQRAVLETLKVINYAPDIIHCHDWQAGLIPVYLKTVYAKTALFKKTKTIFTIHNLGYQGNFPPDSLPMTGLSWDEFKMEKLEFYGKISFIKGGIVYSDAVTTVSESYTRQIQTREFGCGLENVMVARKKSLYGVLNGIDYQDWNPETDKALVKNFSRASLAGKAANKKKLQTENGFPTEAAKPLVGMITRLVDQKGLDILIPAMEEMIGLDIQFVLLGTGEEKYHKILRAFGKKNKEQFGIHIVFDNKMARRIYAGCDMFLLPSYYEPCGLGQMIALRYGTIPIVRETGGLADTVEAFDEKKGIGNGFLFKDYTAEALLQALQSATEAYRREASWQALIKNAMEYDFSWTASAKRYLDIYESVHRGKIQSSDK